MKHLSKLFLVLVMTLQVIVFFELHSQELITKNNNEALFEILNLRTITVHQIKNSEKKERPGRLN